jgi:rubrerythrin
MGSMENHSIRLTAPEMSSLWTQYIFESMSIRFFKYALGHIDDKDIKNIYKMALQLSERHIQQIEEFYKGENYPIPKGFTEDDVNLGAPRLFQDPLYLYYIYIMTLQGLSGYALSVGTSIRADLRKYYITCNTETMMLYDNTIDTMLTKGLFTRPPVLSPPAAIDFVKHQTFLTGWFGDRRPLTGIEIGDITFNMNKMNLHVALKVGFSQVAKSEKVRKFINRGTEISNKHLGIFTNILREEKLNTPMSWQSFVTNSTTPTFSDKFMMYQVQLSTQLAIAFYGTALSVTSRRDIGLKYLELIMELTKFGEDGVNLMIDNGWLEEPPKGSDRQSLTKGKKEDQKNSN